MKAAMPGQSFFRPAYTHNIIRKLKQGSCILIKSAPGQGVIRLLEDTAEEIPRSLKVDFARKDSPPLEQWNEQLHADASDWEEAWDKLLESGGNYCLLISNVEKADEHIQSVLFPLLKQANLKPSLSLLAVTEQRDFESDFAMEILSLPPMSYKRIQEELARSLPETKEVQLMSKAIFSYREPYTLLQYLIGRVKNEGNEIEISKQLLLWLEEFASERGETLIKPENKKSFWKRLFGK